MQKQLENAKPQRSVRFGFTLVEVLMVMLLIAILVGLLVPVIAAAYRRGREAAEITEINSLVTVIERFKDRYGVYPPSQIILREDGDYSSASGSPVAAITNDQPMLGVGGVFVKEVSIQYLKRIWPQIQLNTSSSTGGPPRYIDTNNNGQVDSGEPFYDWNGNNTFDDVTYYLSGDECLVFFLGGIPAGQPLDNPTVRAGQGPPSTNGFSRDPRNPTIAPIAGTATVSRDDVRYEFDSKRLADWDQNSFYEYLPLRRPGNRGGYAYFSSYEGAGYRPDDMNIDTTNVSTELEASDENSIPQNLMSTFNVFRVLWPVPANYPTAYKYNESGVTTQTAVASPGPNPYTVGAPYEPQSSTVAPKVRYLKDNSFQLISPGIDNSYGQGGAIPRFGPTDVKDYYKETKWDDDNLASFAGGELKDEGAK
jgi:general secretion pathway protein G